MATKEPTTVETDAAGAVSNSTQIEFPFDQYGATTMLRKEGVRAIGRIKGDPLKLETFMQTLRVLAQHANSKLADQQKEAAQSSAAYENRALAASALAVRDKKATVVRLRGLLVAAEASLEAVEADNAPAPAPDKAAPVVAS